ncbi:MAG: hypothetical protein DF168_01415 [Candidatus Moanabacter tarae]|uniref:Uncharacterized protein n=1 Tax=Candidatus Moanibacter tarae TaxID=2200854 RepID=A0A2Z4ADB2_9BACT|nr:MAG: hypothetical protein DF168_01415 [Candidatus Moanabacter tarae]
MVDWGLAILSTSYSQATASRQSYGGYSYPNLATTLLIVVCLSCIQIF